MRFFLFLRFFLNIRILYLDGQNTLSPVQVHPRCGSHRDRGYWHRKREAFAQQDKIRLDDRNGSNTVPDTGSESDLDQNLAEYLIVEFCSGEYWI